MNTPSLRPTTVTILRGLPALVVLLWLTACQPTQSTPSASTTDVAPVSTAAPAAADAPILVPTPAPAEENSVPPMDITLPAGWQVTGAPAASAPGRGVVATGPNGALLTVMTLRQRGLALTSYVEETATLLSRQELIVNRAGVVYDVRADGAPVGVIDYTTGDGSGAAVQWSLLHPSADELWVITLAARPADLASAAQDVETWLATLDPAAP